MAARGHGQNSFLVDKQQPAAIGREAREVSRAELMRHAAGRGNQPYFLGHWALRGVINVGRSPVLKTLAPGEGDRLRIRRPGEFADIETVVLCVRCDLARFRAMRGVCYPDITATLRAEYPRDGCALGRCQHVPRKRRLHHIVECKGAGWVCAPASVAVIPSTAMPATATITLHANLFTLPPLPLLTGCSGVPTIPQVHYSHNDVAVFARFRYWLGGGFRSYFRRIPCSRFTRARRVCPGQVHCRRRGHHGVSENAFSRPSRR